MPKIYLIREKIRVNSDNSWLCYSYPDFALISQPNFHYKTEH